MLTLEWNFTAESTTNTASKTYEPENPNPIKGFVQAVSGAGEKIIGKLSKSGSHGDVSLSSRCPLSLKPFLGSFPTQLPLAHLIPPSPKRTPSKEIQYGQDRSTNPKTQHSPTHTSPSAASASTNNNDDNNNSDNMATQAQFSASTANHPADAGPGAAPEGEDLGERYEQANRDLNRE